MTVTTLAGRYRVLRPLGVGGMGTVHEAVHLGTGRHVAVKLLSGDGRRDVDVARFEGEARALGELSHPGIVDVVDFGFDEEAGLPYLVMELLEGRDLESFVAARRGSDPVSLDEAVALLGPVAGALDFAHGRGIVHRDVKPSNVFLAREADGRQVVKLLDFGLAAIRERGPERRTAAARAGSPVGRGLTQDGLIVGTLNYIAPEVAYGERAGPAADRFALAVVAFELLTGSWPFPGPSFEEVARAARDGDVRRLSSLRSDLPPEIDAVFARALAGEAAERYPTAAAFVEELGRMDALERERAEADRRVRRERRRRTFAAFAAPPAALLLVAACHLLPSLPAVRTVEDRSVDARLELLQKRDRALDLVFVVVDEAALAADPTPLALQAGRFAGAIDGLFAAGARAVAVDFLLPASWAESLELSRTVRAHASRLVLAAFARPDGSVTGHEAVAGLTTVALGAREAAEVFGLVNLEGGADGYLRRARPAFVDESPAPRDAFAARLARLAGRAGPDVLSRSTRPVLLDGRIRWRDAPVVSWKDLPNELKERGERFAGRVAVIGGTFDGSGDDLLRVPSAGRERVSGVFIQGLLAETFASPVPLREPGRAAWSGLLSAAALAAFAAVLVLRWKPAAALLGAAAALWAAASLALVPLLSLVPPLPSLLLAGAAGAALAGAVGWLGRLVSAR